MFALNNIYPCTSVSVVVTFLRMDSIPQQKILDLPNGYSLKKLSFISVPLYRYLYHAVGSRYCWWMRQVMSDQSLEQLLNDRLIEIYLLKDKQDIITGFFELDCRNSASVNIAYFGLMPYAVGLGLGTAFFHQAIRYAWCKKPNYLKINTCNLDHSRALPLYKKSGFEITKVATEIWNIPDHLNLPIPEKFIQKIR